MDHNPRLPSQVASLRAVDGPLVTITTYASEWRLLASRSIQERVREWGQPRAATALSEREGAGALDVPAPRRLHTGTGFHRTSAVKARKILSGRCALDVHRWLSIDHAARKFWSCREGRTGS